MVGCKRVSAGVAAAGIGGDSAGVSCCCHAHSAHFQDRTSVSRSGSRNTPVRLNCPQNVHVCVSEKTAFAGQITPCRVRILRRYANCDNRGLTDDGNCSGEGVSRLCGTGWRVVTCKGTEEGGWNSEWEVLQYGAGPDALGVGCEWSTSEAPRRLCDLCGLRTGTLPCPQTSSRP